MNTFDSFDQLNLVAPLACALEKMSFIKPTPVQAASIPAALQGKDILGTAQTGTGKTGAFGIPMMAALYADSYKRALVLAPTRELAAQIYTVLNQICSETNMAGVLAVGGESFRNQERDIRRGWDFIVATPGRLNDHLERNTINLDRIEVLVLDEVDRMLDMGFIPQIKRIMRFVPIERQTLLFSATLPPDVKALTESFLRAPVRVEIGSPELTAPKVETETIRTTPEGKNSIVLKEMREREGKVLVFTRTKSRTERLAKLLHQQGHRVVALHGGRSQSQRREALERFRRGSHRVMVATDLAGRGIDVADIEHVINYDVPSTREDYIHRIGRTGRAGKSGQALNLLINGDRDGEEVISGEKRQARVVYRSRRRR